MARATSQPHGTSLMSTLGYFHVTLSGRNLEEINPDIIKEKIRIAGGVRYDNTEKFEGKESIIENGIKP